MKFLYWLLTYAGFVSFVMGALMLFGNMTSHVDASLFLAGLVMLALCDIGSKLNGLAKRLDAIEIQQKRLRRLFLDLMPVAPAVLPDDE